MRGLSVPHPLVAFFFLLYFSCGWANGEGLMEHGDYSNNETAPMLEGEKEALYSTIQGFVGKWWNGSDLYPDPCGWTPIQGVSCDSSFNGYWYITGIAIGPVHENSLTCTAQSDPSTTMLQFPPHLFKLTHLKSLTFFSCFTRSTAAVIPSAGWENLANTLESLEFRSNPGLIGPIPHSFASLKNLQSLILLNNGLSGQIPPNIGDLSRQKRLVLSGNSFTGEIPYSIGNLTDLLILDLSRNSLSGSIPFTLGGGLGSLIKLDLSGNVLSGMIPKQVGRMKRLTLLDVSDNNLIGGLGWVEGMEALEELVLSDNVNLGGEMESVKWENRVRNLVILGLSNVGLTGGVPESIVKLKRLRYLDVSNNMISGEVPPKLTEMTSISAVYLNGNGFEGELRFPRRFYERLGRRFRAENNPNLCRVTEEDDDEGASVVGVKPCRRGSSAVTMFNEKNGLNSSSQVLGAVDDGGRDVVDGDGSQLVLTEAATGRSSSSSSGGVGAVGIWWGFMVGSLMVSMLCTVSFVELIF